MLATFGNMPLINSVTDNSLEWNEHKNTRYPAVACDLQNATVDENGNATYNYILTGAMIGVESEADRVRNYTTMMQVLYEGIEAIKDDVDVSDTYTFTFGSLKYFDVLDCATCQVAITTEMENLCQ
jgi:hypothetical protein